jgi:hypothetical protein
MTPFSRAEPLGELTHSTKNPSKLEKFCNLASDHSSRRSLEYNDNPRTVTL